MKKGSIKSVLRISFYILSVFLLNTGCKKIKDTSSSNETGEYLDTRFVGAMKNVMWKGQLEGRIKLDSISEKSGLYALGPEAFLRGEILVTDGKSYVSRVTSDSTMQVVETYNASAPFLVYTNVNEWTSVAIPDFVKTIKDLENFINDETINYKRPFAFKLIGEVVKAKIHIQNLPLGTKVSSPKEAHQGQTNYDLKNVNVEIIGFFSTEHHGVFTHHDTNIHMHLITETKDKMGHLDALEIKKMRLLLPKK